MAEQSSAALEQLFFGVAVIGFVIALVVSPAILIVGYWSGIVDWWVSLFEFAVSVLFSWPNGTALWAFLGGFALVVMATWLEDIIQ